MSYSIAEYESSGILICTPDSGLSDAGAALNSNFIALAELMASTAQNPMTSSLDAGGFDISNIVNRKAAIFTGAGFIQTSGFMPSGNNPWSVSFWVRTTSTEVYNALAFWGSRTAKSGITLVISDQWGADFQFAVNVRDTNAYYGLTSGALNDGKWHFCVATYVGSTLTIYVDNVAQSLASAGGYRLER